MSSGKLTQGSPWGRVKESDKDVSFNDAHPITRLFAFLIDFVIFKVLAFVIFFLLVRFSIFQPALLAEVSWRTNVYEYRYYFQNLSDLYLHIALSSLFIGYFTVLESRWVLGASIGKKLLGLKVVDSYGENISLKKSFIRNSTKEILRIPIIGFVLGFIELGLIIFFFVRSGDILAHTHVAGTTYKGKFPFRESS